MELNRHGVKSHSIVRPPDDRPPAFCIFEYVYFARPDTILEGKRIFRKFRNLECRHRFRETKIFSVKMQIFSYPSVLTYVLGAHKNRLIETVLLSTHNICFG